MPRCTGCGANVVPHAEECDYCGSNFPERTHQEPGRPSRAEAFERIKCSPEFATCESIETLARLPKLSELSLASPILWLLGLCGALLTITVACSTAIPPVGKYVSLIPLAIAGLGILSLVSTVRSVRRFQRAPVETAAAVLIGKRLHVAHDKAHNATTYYLTFELEDGSRQELRPLSPSLYARLAENDEGILFQRMDVLLEFKRV